MNLKLYYIVILLLDSMHCLLIIPERTKVTFYSKEHIKYVRVAVKRYSRRSNYYLNIEGYNKHTWANNITIHIICTEFLHNEYRRSFIEFHYRLCDLINKEPLIGAMIKQRSPECPVPVGDQRLMNMTFQTQNIPNNVWPYEKGGFDVEVSITGTKQIIAQGYIHARFISQPDKKVG